jgi:hypothetical protein
MKLRTLLVSSCSLIALSISAAVSAKPVPLPDPGIKGYSFPEDKQKLMAWINAGNSNEIYLHGWGLWTSLTAPSGQNEYGLKNVPVYLTWLTPAEIAALPRLKATEKKVDLPAKRTFLLEKPRQMTHKAKGLEQAASAVKSSAAASSATPLSIRDTNIVVTMGYDPAAQDFAYHNNLFSLKALQAFYNSGSGNIRSIPVFPNNAVTVKPTYKVITKANMLNGSIYVMPAWPGTPPVVTPEITANGFPETSWPGCVYINTKNTGTSTAASFDKDCTAGSNASNTYGLGDFVYYPVTKDNIAAFKVLVSGQEKLAVGDVIVLMAMHVTSREIDEWTWQTYFWTPDPTSPPLPSSSAIASTRPAQLTGAAAHYAMAIGYQMVTPNQPAVGGQSVGGPVVAYNPYLEAGFNAATFGTPPVNVGILAPGSQTPYMATVGIQTNCMTCHSNATVDPSNPNPNTNSLPYLTNFYVSREDQSFKGFLQLDFLWSIQGTAK